MPSTRLGSANIKDTLPDNESRAAVDHVAGACDLLALQEWPGGRNPILADMGRYVRGPLLVAPRARGDWTWARPRVGGGPIGSRNSDYKLEQCHAVALVGAEAVEGTAIAGVPRRGKLPTSWATVARYLDLEQDDRLVAINIHLTAGVQDGHGRYKSAEVPLRVARHKRERAALQSLVDHHLARNRRVVVLGDSNFNHMPIKGLRGWWEVDGMAHTGTEGNRAIDLVSASWALPVSVQILQTASDHNHPVATYKEHP